jgi:hypothetical protein
MFLTTIARIKDGLRQQLPRINKAAERLHLTPEAVYGPLIDIIITLKMILDARLDSIDQPTARKALQVIAFPVASLEKHQQSAGGQPGDGLARVPGTGLVLARLGKVADYPPVNSHYTCWLDQADDPDPLTFTGDAQEVFFLRVVNRQVELQGNAVKCLRPICAGDLDVGSAGAIEAFEAATQSIAELYLGHYVYFTRRGPDGRPGMTGEFFRKDFRTNYVTIPILGEMWPGPNATNIKEQPCLDRVVGLNEPWYDETVRKRFRHYTRQDREVVEADLRTPSVLDRFLDRIGASTEELLRANPDEIDRRLAQQTDQFRTSLAAFKELYLAIGQVSNLHAALIKKWLNVGQPAESKDHTKLTVSDKVGVSGEPLEHALAINAMRVKNPFLRRLLQLERRGPTT